LRSLFNNACVITAHFYTLCLSFPFFKGISRVVTFLHCSIFKMLFRVSLSCGTLLLYHIQKILSSTFFKFFQNFLFVIFAVLCRPAFLLYHIQFSLSSTFSSFLKNFSVWPPVLSDQLFYYITFNSICQVLFSSFPKFSFKWLVTRLTVQLLYYITYRSLCQVLFFKKSKTSANLTFRSPKTFSIFPFVPVLSSDSFIIISPFSLIVKQKMRCGKWIYLVTLLKQHEPQYK